MAATRATPWHPSREDIAKAQTREELEAVRAALAAWQAELSSSSGVVAEQNEEDGFTVVGKQPPPSPPPHPQLPVEPEHVPTPPPPPVQQQQQQQQPRVEEDGFVVMEPTPGGEVASSAGGDVLGRILPKTPLTCAEVGCSRLVARADSSLHRCAHCRHVWCSLHSSKLLITISNGGATVTPLCERCSERASWQPGITRDKSDAFFRARARWAEQRNAEVLAWRQAVATSVEEPFLDPQAAQLRKQQQQQQQSAAPTVLMGLFRSIVLTAQDTWAQCAVCGAFFDRLSIKRNCNLCKRDVCQSCGVSETALDVRVAERLLGKPFASPPPPARATAMLRCCGRCAARVHSETMQHMLSQARKTAPEWIARHDASLQLCACVASELALLGELQGSDAERVRNSIAAMVAELQDAASWFVSLERKLPPFSAQARLVRGIRRRLLAGITSAKERLIRSRVVRGVIQ